jgi:hypothetical protein
MKLTGSFGFDILEVVFINYQVSANENVKKQVIFEENETILLLHNSQSMQRLIIQM